jgi:hypothetical protein
VTTTPAIEPNALALGADGRPDRLASECLAGCGRMPWPTSTASAPVEVDALAVDRILHHAV